MLFGLLLIGTGCLTSTIQYKRGLKIHKGTNVIIVKIEDADTAEEATENAADALRMRFQIAEMNQEQGYVRTASKQYNRNIFSSNVRFRLRVAVIDAETAKVTGDFVAHSSDADRAQWHPISYRGQKGSRALTSWAQLLAASEHIGTVIDFRTDPSSDPRK